VRTGVFPGSFDPLTIAHLAIADAARSALELDRVELVISRVALAKEHPGHAPVAERLAAIERVAADGRPWLSARVTDARLIADIAEGFDACVLGADKWAQVLDPAFYGGSEELVAQALARLPRLAVAPREGSPPPSGLPLDAVVLELAASYAEVSSSAVRAGRDAWRA
jgi:hypothetical protein